MSTWQFENAKKEFSKIVELAINKGPQMISSRGKESVVIISHDEYMNLIRRKKPLIEVLKSAPIANLDLSNGTCNQKYQRF